MFIESKTPKVVPKIIEKSEIINELRKNNIAMSNCLTPKTFNKTISLNFSLIKKIWLEIIVKDEIITIKKSIRIFLNF